MMPKNSTNETNNLSRIIIKKIKNNSVFLTFLPLTACGGGDGGGEPVLSTPTPLPILPEPELINFTQTSANTFIASSNNNSLFSFSDTSDNLNVTGGNGGDTIITGDGDDIVFGGAGDDTIYGGTGSDNLDGGDGVDVLFFGSVDTRLLDGDRQFISMQTDVIPNNGVNINLQTNTAFGGVAENLTISNFEMVIGTNTRDFLTGSDGDNYLAGNGGNDVINGGAGNDLLHGDGVSRDFFGDDNLNGGEGNDTIIGGPGNDILIGGNGNDDLFDNIGNNTLNGGEGDDDLVVVGSLEGDINILNGGPGNDLINGGSGIEIVDGGDGNEYFEFSDGDDILNGGPGDDIIRIGNGAKVVDGGDDDDLFDIFLTNDFTDDQIDGGSGNDKLDINNLNAAVQEEISLGDFQLENIEGIRLSGRIEIELTLQDVLDVTDVDEVLIIEDNINRGGGVVSSTGQAWVQGADQMIDGETYHSYTSGTGTLLIDEDIVQTIS